MKIILLTLITAYQKIVSPLLHQLLGQQSICRYEKSCSAYAKEVIATRGVVRGSILFVKRFVSCQPLGRPYVHI